MLKQDIEKQFIPVINILKELGCSDFKFNYPFTPMSGENYIALSSVAPNNKTLMHCGIAYKADSEIQQKIDELVVKLSDTTNTKDIIDSAMSK